MALSAGRDRRGQEAVSEVVGTFCHDRSSPKAAPLIVRFLATLSGRSASMRSSLLVASAGCLLVVAGNQYGCPQESPTKPGRGTAAAHGASTQPAGPSNFIVGAPVRYKNLTIFPVLSKTAQN